MNTQRLGDHVSFLSGFAFKSSHFNDSGKGMPVIRIRDVTRGYSKTYYYGEYSDRYIVDNGDYLIGMDGEFNLARWTSGTALLNQRVCKIDDVSENVDRSYLARFLPLALKEIEDSTPFVTVKHLSVKKLNDIQIPLPPLEEQKRIAKILDAADALRAKRRESLAQLDALLQSTFLDLFGDPIANPYAWEMGLVGDMLESANYGTSKKASESAGRYPILRMGNITYEGGWDMSSMKYIDLEGKEEEKYLVRKGDILFNRTNSRELVGKTAVYRSDEPIAFAGYLVRARACREADPEYIAAFMNTPQTKSRLVSMCKSIVGMANINAKEFQGIPIPVPPLDLQQKFSTIVEAVLRQKEALTTHLEEFDVFFSALQQKAFSGNL